MKNIKGILSLTLVIIFLVGCSSTETMTANEFKKSMEKKGFTVVDQTACRVLKKENTVLYVTAYHDYEDEAKSVVKELGYK